MKNVCPGSAKGLMNLNLWLLGRAFSTWLCSLRKVLTSPNTSWNSWKSTQVSIRVISPSFRSYTKGEFLGSGWPVFTFLVPINLPLGLQCLLTQKGIHFK